MACQAMHLVTLGRSSHEPRYTETRELVSALGERGVLRQSFHRELVSALGSGSREYYSLDALSQGSSAWRTKRSLVAFAAWLIAACGFCRSKPWTPPPHMCRSTDTPAWDNRIA